MLQLVKECFSVNLNDYESFGVDFEINKAIAIGFFILCIGAVALNIYRGNIRLMVNQLVRHGAYGEDNAKSLKELGLDKHKIIRYMLKRDNLLTGVVSVKGKQEYTYEEYLALKKEKKLKEEPLDVDLAQFYICEEKKDRCEHILDRYVTSPTRTLVSVLFIVIMCVCIISSMPEILGMLDNLLGRVSV